MTKEQTEAIAEMREKFAIWSSKNEALQYFAIKFGKTNIHVVEFRQMLERDYKKFEDAQNECERLGVIDELLNLL